MRKFDPENRKALAAWALDCADRTLPLFERAMPGDDRPGRAIEAGRAWVRTGEFSMPVIRGVAAHAAGQAVAAAHVPQHAYGTACYALKAIIAADPADAAANTAREFTTLSGGLPERLRQEIMGRLSVEKRGSSYAVKLDKGPGF